MISTGDNRPVCIIAVWGLVLAVLAGIVVLIAGPGTRWGWWDFRTGFSLLSWGAFIGLLAVVVCIVGAVKARPQGPLRGFSLAAMGFLLGLIVFGFPYLWNQKAQQVPPIHDITTDMDNPPAFVAIMPLRQETPNPPDYGGAEIASQQRAAYPKIRPLTLSIPPDQAFSRALTVARKMHWEIVAAVPAEGRIEATDTTFWFGFKDDIVIRVTPDVSGSRIDVRSVSRVGRSDVGTNARRIGKFLKKMS